MTIDVIRPWASAGLKETPSNAKIDLGWLPGEQPAMDWENERQNKRDMILKALAEYINAGISLSDLIAGTTDITDGNFVFAMSPNLIRLLNLSDGSFIKFMAGTGIAENSLEYYSASSGRTCKMNVGGVGVSDGSTSTTIFEKGVSYNGLSANLKSYDASALTFTVDSGSGLLWRSTDVLTLTDIPFGSKIIGAAFSCILASGAVASCPCFIGVTNSSGTARVGATTLVGSISDPDSGTDKKLYVWYTP